MWIQKDITLAARPRGFHLITRDVVLNLPEISDVRVGLLHLFIQHTSASLSINENADPDVRIDMESAFNAVAPENAEYYTHRVEGPDDMPAHVKASMLGCSVWIPVRGGLLHLGKWQGVYLCEHRDHGGPRHVVATLHGE